jgi:deazaflavin-dependent oxidoreductase (nitroreductase family)
MPGHDREGVPLERIRGDEPRGDRGVPRQGRRGGGGGRRLLQGQADSPAPHHRGEDRLAAAEAADVPRRGRPPLCLASKGGAPDNPGWFYNLRAHPDATVEADRESYPVRATEITGGERDRIYATMVSRFPQFGEYQEKTSRTIPVVALQRTG